MPIVIRTYSFMCAYCTKVHVTELECITHERTHSLEDRRKVDGPDLPSTAPIAQVHLKQRDQLKKLLTDAAQCLEEDVVMLKGLSNVRAVGLDVKPTATQGTSTASTIHHIQRQERPRLEAMHMNGTTIVPPMRSKPFRYPTVPTEFRGIAQRPPLYRPIRPRIMASSITTSLRATLGVPAPPPIVVQHRSPPALTSANVADSEIGGMVVASSSAIETHESGDDEEDDAEYLDEVDEQLPMETEANGAIDIMNELFNTPHGMTGSKLGVSVRRTLPVSLPIGSGRRAQTVGNGAPIESRRTPTVGGAHTPFVISAHTPPISRAPIGSIPVGGARTLPIGTANGNGPVIDSALGRMKSKYSKIRAQKTFGNVPQRLYTLQCEVCKQMFNKRWNLHRHELQQHDIRSPGNFQNLVCKKDHTKDAVRKTEHPQELVCKKEPLQ